jgi:hypothetical protein
LTSENDEQTQDDDPMMSFDRHLMQENENKKQAEGSSGPFGGSGPRGHGGW